MGRPTYKEKMEKRFDISLRQGYVNKGTELINSGMIPINNSDILHCVIVSCMRKVCPEKSLKIGALKIGIDTAGNVDPS